MKIGITGASGLIGQRVAALASDRGHEIIGYSRTPDKPIPHTSKVLPISEDGLAETPLDALVHLAGESLLGIWTDIKRKRIWKSRVDLTQSIVKSISGWDADNRPKTFLCASGVGFYGNRGDDILTESEPVGKGFLASLCEAWEAAANEAGQFGSRVVNLRTGVVLSEKGGAFPLMRFAFSCFVGGRIGDGTQWMPWIHLDDEASLILHAIENDQISGPINLSAPTPVTNATLTTTLATTLHRPALFPAPAPILRVALGSLAEEVLLTSQRAIPSQAQESGYTFKFTDLATALKHLTAPH